MPKRRGAKKSGGTLPSAKTGKVRTSIQLSDEVRAIVVEAGGGFLVKGVDFSAEVFAKLKEIGEGDIQEGWRRLSEEQVK